MSCSLFKSYDEFSDGVIPLLSPAPTRLPFGRMFKLQTQEALNPWIEQVGCHWLLSAGGGSPRVGWDPQGLSPATS